MTTSTWRLIAAAAVGLSAAHVLAHDPPAAPAKPPAAAPGAPTTPKTPTAPAKPAAPARVRAPKPVIEEPPAAPVMPKVRVATRRGQMLPEGTFLVSRRGQLVEETSADKWGGWIYRFEPDARGAAEAPMVLMPCVRLEAMKQLAANRTSGVEYSISGQVFVYQGQNYLLPVYEEARAAAPTPAPTPKAKTPESEEPDADAEGEGEPKPEAGPADAAPPAPAAPPGPAPGSPEDEVQRRIRALDAATHDRRLPIPSAPPAPATTGAEATGSTPSSTPVAELRTAPKRGGLVAEGTYLASRRGRLIRESAGEWVMRFDADAQGQVDPPMLVLPCLNLEGMERVAANRGDAANFVVSGQVYVFEGRNYLLPTLYRVVGINQDLLPGR